MWAGHQLVTQLDKQLATSWEMLCFWPSSLLIFATDTLDLNQQTKEFSHSQVIAFYTLGTDSGDTTRTSNIHRIQF